MRDQGQSEKPSETKLPLNEQKRFQVIQEMKKKSSLLGPYVMKKTDTSPDMSRSW